MALAFGPVPWGSHPKPNPEPRAHLSCTRDEKQSEAASTLTAFTPSRPHSLPPSIYLSLSVPSLSASSSSKSSTSSCSCSKTSSSADRDRKTCVWLGFNRALTAPRRLMSLQAPEPAGGHRYGTFSQTLAGRDRAGLGWRMLSRSFRGFSDLEQGLLSLLSLSTSLRSGTGDGLRSQPGLEQ